jgi:hypothetical protein
VDSIFYLLGKLPQCFGTPWFRARMNRSIGRCIRLSYAGKVSVQNQMQAMHIHGQDAHATSENRPSG